MFVAVPLPVLLRTTARSLHSFGSTIWLPLPPLIVAETNARAGFVVKVTFAHHVPQSCEAVLRAHSCVTQKLSSAGSEETLAKSPQRSLLEKPGLGRFRERL